MLFIVPDEDLFSPDSNPDQGPADQGDPQNFKVELDLDDAPFLDEPEEEQPQPEPAPAATERTESEPALNGRASLLDRLRENRKKLLIGAAAGVLILLTGLTANTFLFSDDPEPVRAEAPRREEEPPRQEEEIVAPAYVVEWPPFMIEKRGSEGEIRFLYCQFNTPAGSPLLQSEILSKQVPLRDAIYHYLMNRPLTFLTNVNRQDELREDLMTVINEHLSTGKISELYFEEYVVRGS